MSEDHADLKRRVAELEKQLEAERSKGKQTLRLQVSEKGGVSLYGIRRFPVTFYLEEWEQILGMAEEIRAFLSEHRSELKRK